MFPRRSSSIPPLPLPAINPSVCALGIKDCNTSSLSVMNASVPYFSINLLTTVSSDVSPIIKAFASFISGSIAVSPPSFIPWYSPNLGTKAPPALGILNGFCTPKLVVIWSRIEGEEEGSSLVKFSAVIKAAGATGACTASFSSKAGGATPVYFW